MKGKVEHSWLATPARARRRSCIGLVGKHGDDNECGRPRRHVFLAFPVSLDARTTAAETFNQSVHFAVHPPADLHT